MALVSREQALKNMDENLLNWCALNLKLCLLIADQNDMIPRMRDLSPHRLPWQHSSPPYRYSGLRAERVAYHLLWIFLFRRMEKVTKKLLVEKLSSSLRHYYVHNN